MAYRGGRVIDTDTLRISPVVQVSSDGQEREQDSEDNPKLMRIRTGLSPFPLQRGARHRAATCASTLRVPPFEEYRL